MILPIITYGASILRDKSLEITEKEGIDLLAANMFETLKRNNGIGLAAPQVNLLKNMFIIDTTPLECEQIPIFEKVFFNPEILYFGKEISDYDEGCLSIPGIFENVKRPTEIEVRYYDILFNMVEEKLDGITARIFQHEYDHLQGILFIDRINNLKRKLINSKLQRISRHGISR